ncbi:MAG: thioredoxin family protein [Pirellulaceae bacterium]|jgi:thioredoxin-like negative regulator of GroEL|nr:thioredoxin family protein [Pirellulaceae bacterium]
MRMVIAVLFVLAVAPAVAQETATQKRQVLDYTTAYNRCQSGDKPMLVLVTATWCPPCQKLKSSVLPSLLTSESLSELNFAMVDYDKEPSVAQQLIGDRGVPQLIYFQKVENRWVQRYITGYQTLEAIEDFIRKGNPVQIADAGSEIKK